MTATETVEPVALTAEDVGHLLRISTRSVWRFVSSGVLPPPARVGSRPRWDRGTVLQWWRERQPGGDPR